MALDQQKLKIALLATPKFALPSFEMLLEEGYQVAAVFTQPDRPAGRGHKLMPPPVKVRAQQAGIPVYQFERISRDGLDVLRQLAPDLMITVAFGQILSREVLAVPPLGCINVHGSLLPKYRGAAPIEWAVIHGEKSTGITTMYTKYELDAGDILEQDQTEIREGETGGELRERLSVLGAVTLSRTLKKLLEGTLTATAQDEEQATYYPMFPRGFGEVDFSGNAQEIVHLIHGLNPVPAAYTYVAGNKVKLLRARALDGTGTPGQVICADAKQGLVVQTAQGRVEILRLQYPGAKQMDAKDFLRGRKVFEQNMILGGEPCR